MVVFCVVNDAELARGDSMDLGLGMNHERSGSGPFQSSWMILRGMTDLKGHFSGLQSLREEMEVMNREVLLIGCFWVIPMRHIEDIVLHILFDDEPRSSTKAHPLSLPNGMEPEALVLTNTLTGLQLYDIARVLTQIPADIIIVIDFTKETNAL